MKRDRKLRSFAVVASLVISSVLSSAQGETYDPLAARNKRISTLDIECTDEDRDRRIPLRIYLPAIQSTSPVVVFSHGLGGSRKGSRYLGKHWSERGYAAVFIQHPGSDESIWKDKPKHKRMAALKRAANRRNFMRRVRDIPAVLDQLESWNTSDGHALNGKLNLERVGMSGHSFGALTTQAVSGQAYWGRRSLADARIKAAIAFSPRPPKRGTPEKAFGKVDIPWMLMTGTKDEPIIGSADAESRLDIFPALPAGDKYEVVLHGAEHMAFTDMSLAGEVEKRNPNHHRAILALSTAFWDACLRDDEAAGDWLQGEDPRAILESRDQWRKK